MVYMEDSSWSVLHDEINIYSYLNDKNIDWCKIVWHYYTTMTEKDLSDLQKMELQEAFNEFDKVNFKMITTLIYEFY
jgi:hypothetical protein